MTRVGLVLTLGVVLGASCGCRPSPSEVDSPADDRPIDRLNRAMESRDWEEAERFSQPALVADPENPELITKVALIAAFRGRKREAARLLVDAAEVADYQPLLRVDRALQALIDEGELYDAMDLLGDALDTHEESHRHRRMLVGFLGEAQRNELIPPHLQRLIRARQFDVPLLASLADPSMRRFSHQTAEKLIARNPEDQRIRLAEAFQLIEQRNARDADAVLHEILQHHPDFAPAHAMLGQVLCAQNRFDALADWSARTAEGSDRFPNYWLTLGDWAAESNEFDAAARGYWEATRRDPDNLIAWTRLIRAARILSEQESAVIEQASLIAFEQRAERLTEFRRRVANFETSDQTSQRCATRVAESLLALGRLWEAEAWSAAATTLSSDPGEQLSGVRETILQRLQRTPEWQSKQDQPALTVDLSNLPLPKTGHSAVTRQRLARTVPERKTTSHLRLQEESRLWGLSGIGANNNPDHSGMTALIRSTGAGGGAIDFDLDGLPDLVIMTAGGTMGKSDSPPNELLRNVGGRFTRVANLAGVTDTRFGQGVAVGDFNEDGFPDLFFANLGRNQLYSNNGDGTFTACPGQLQDGGAEDWTTCGAFVDLDLDGITDLLTTNYCDTSSPIDEACPNEDGVLGPCPPLHFPADGDQFLRGRGDGALTDVTASWIPELSPGRGLGLIAGTFDGQALSAYIANDMSANFLFNVSDGGATKLADTATPRGVAVDGQSLPQASMGIAASDFDRDGDLDFYVTGFGREYNVLYEQIAPGLWKDETQRANLAQPTLMVVGFGTEAIDLDSDGLEEIIVTNGHIGKFPVADALPYAQPLQVFRRDGDGRFELVDDDRWGDYFTAPHVGRALWTLDANRDGRNDLLITHAHEACRLLINRGKDDNRRVAFRLVGSRCSRDAVGAIVRFRCNGRPYALWQNAGDGYLCSNERILRAGLGAASRIEAVTVQWPDGTTQNFGDLSGNAEYLIVEGEPEAFRQTTFPLQPTL